MQEQQFENTFSDFERVSVSTKLAELIPAELLESDRSAYKRRTRTQKFQISVDGVMRNLMNRFEDLGLSETDLNMALDATTNVDVEYKNPCGWVLGYLASRRGRKDIDGEYLRYIIDNIMETANYSGGNQESWGVTAPDVLRYTRFWKRYEN